MGKFHGVIRPTTPTGSRVISTPMPGRTEGKNFARQAQAFAGEELEDLAGAGGLADAFGRVLPSSRASSVPSSSLRARISLPILSSASLRAWMLPVDQAGKAAVAAATASSTCTASPWAYSPSTSPRLLTG